MGQEINNTESYVYIEWNGKDHFYVMYDKMSTVNAWKRTGKFTIELDKKWGSVISGNYDNGVVNWNQKYMVNDLTDTSMTWTVKGDASDVSVYTRCNSIPANIKTSTLDY